MSNGLWLKQDKTKKKKNYDHIKVYNKISEQIDTEQP